MSMQPKEARRRRERPRPGDRLWGPSGQNNFVPQAGPCRPGGCGCRWSHSGTGTRVLGPALRLPCHCPLWASVTGDLWGTFQFPTLNSLSLRKCEQGPRVVQSAPP